MDAMVDSEASLPIASASLDEPTRTKRSIRELLHLPNLRLDGPAYRQPPRHHHSPSQPSYHSSATTRILLMVLSNKQVAFLVTAAAVAKLNDAAGKCSVCLLLLLYLWPFGRISHYNTHTTRPDDD